MTSISLLDDPPDFFLTKEYAELMSHEFVVWGLQIGYSLFSNKYQLQSKT
jgi:hypothetical protein